MKIRVISPINNPTNLRAIHGIRREFKLDESERERERERKRENGERETSDDIRA